jgi:hypothetical protein
VKPARSATAMSLLSCTILLCSASLGGADEAADVDRFLPDLCAAIASSDDAFLREHVRLPFPAQVIVNERGGNPVTARKTWRSIRAIRTSKLCDGLDLAGARAAEQKGGWTITVGRGQFDVRFDVKTVGAKLVLERLTEPATP